MQHLLGVPHACWTDCLGRSGLSLFSEDVMVRRSLGFLRLIFCVMLQVALLFLIVKLFLEFP